MSAPSGLEIPLFASHEKQHVRLLELPQSVLTELEASDPPVLQLKSSTPSQASGPASEHAVLCTPTQTFELRQLQSSNVLHVLQPIAGPAADQDPDATGLALAAKCNGLLELLPATVDAAAYLARTLAPCDDLETCRTELAVTKADAAREAPFSAAEFEAAWREVCAFEARASAWVPAPAVLQDAWRSLLQVATMKGLRWDEALQKEGLLRMVHEEGEALAAVCEAVLRRVAGDGDEGRASWIQIDRVKCVAWLGGDVLLRSLDGPMKKSKFEDQWRGLVPEEWHESIDLGLLEGKVQELDDGRVAPTQPSAHAVAKTTKPPTSKWHAQFAARKP